MIKVLIAEDELIERRYLTQLLGELKADGIEVAAVCSDGDEAVHEAYEKRPDILVLDIEMPKKSGLEAAGEIRRFLPMVRILILTAFGEFEYAKRAIRIGVDDYFVKPGSDEQLLDKVRFLADQIREEHSRQENVLFLEEQLSQYNRMLEEELISAVIFGQEDAADYFRDYIGLKRMELYSFCCGIAYLDPEAVLPDEIPGDIGESFRLRGCRYAAGRYQNEITFLACSDRPIEFGNFREEIFHRLLRFSNGQCICEISEPCRDAGELPAVYRSVKERVERKKGKMRTEEPLRSILHRFESTWLKAAISGSGLDCGGQAIAFSEAFIRRKDGLENAKSGAYLLYMWLTKDIAQFFNRELPSGRMGDIRETLQQCRNYPALQKVVKELLEEILRTTQEQKEKKEDKLVLLVADYLKARFQENISLFDVAEKFQMSQYHLSKMFRKTMGSSFVEYLTGLRVERAKELLMDGELSVTDVAFLVGYQDSGYFSKVFRKSTGLSPREFSESVSRSGPNAKNYHN